MLELPQNRWRFVMSRSQSHAAISPSLHILCPYSLETRRFALSARSDRTLSSTVRTRRVHSSFSMLKNRTGFIDYRNIVDRLNRKTFQSHAHKFLTKCDHFVGFVMNSCKNLCIISFSVLSFTTVFQLSSLAAFFWRLVYIFLFCRVVSLNFSWPLVLSDCPRKMLINCQPMVKAHTGNGQSNKDFPQSVITSTNSHKTIAYDNSL